MKRLSICLLCFVILVSILNSQAFGAKVPRVINYQGRLTNASGTPVADASYLIKFIIYTAATAGSELWNSGYQTVQTKGGLFEIQLGASPMPALSDTIFYSDTTRYLGITVGVDPELTPRTRFLTVPYAYQGLRADTSYYAAANSVNSTAIVDGTIGQQDISNNAITNSKLAPNAVTNDKIQDGTIQFGDIGQNGASAGQVMKWNGLAWVVRNDSAGSCLWNVSDTVIYTNKYWGLARGGAANNLYGTNKFTMVNWGVSSSTGASGQNYDYATVGGGYQNQAAYPYSTIAGGHDNSANGRETTVGGGSSNSASGDYSVIAGGSSNDALNISSAICGGLDNTTSGSYGFVGGGERNVALGSYSAIGGGYSDSAQGDYSFIGGGNQNIATGLQSVVCGGWQNNVGNSNSVISGGSTNNIHSSWSSIPGGEENMIMPGSDFSLVFGWQVQAMMPFRTIFYDAVHPGFIGINRDDMDGPVLGVISVGTNPGNGNAAFLTPGGIWVNGCSRNIKESFLRLEGRSVLERLASMDVTSWQYKGSTERHISPFAEDFVKAFDVGVINPDGTRNNQNLSAVDMAGVALAAAQELYKTTQELDRKTSEIETLKQQVAELEELVKQLAANQSH